MPSAKCKLSVLFASQAPVALILRRGPSKWVQLILWHTDSDSSTQGAWFKGRIYEDRCHLSPNGELFLYFCHGGRLRPGYSDSWSAISRPPWLHALTLWPSGTTYGGGGLFLDNRTVMLRVGYTQLLRTHPDHPARGLDVRIWDDALANEHKRPICEVPHSDWSGMDNRGRLVFSRGGQLLRLKGKQERLIADFSEHKPDPQPAPDAARRPIVEPD